MQLLLSRNTSSKFCTTTFAGIRWRFPHPTGSVLHLQHIQLDGVQGMRALSPYLVEQPPDATHHLGFRLAARLPHRAPQDRGALRDRVRSHPQGKHHVRWWRELRRGRSGAVHVRLVSRVHPSDGACDLEHCRSRYCGMACDNRGCSWWPRNWRVRVLRLDGVVLLAISERAC